MQGGPAPWDRALDLRASPGRRGRVRAELNRSAPSWYVGRTGRGTARATWVGVWSVSRAPVAPAGSPCGGAGSVPPSGGRLPTAQTPEAVPSGHLPPDVTITVEAAHAARALGPREGASAVYHGVEPPRTVTTPRSPQCPRSPHASPCLSRAGKRTTSLAARCVAFQRCCSQLTRGHGSLHWLLWWLPGTRQDTAAWWPLPCAPGSSGLTVSDLELLCSESLLGGSFPG